MIKKIKLVNKIIFCDQCGGTALEFEQKGLPFFSVKNIRIKKLQGAYDNFMVTTKGLQFYIFHNYGQCMPSQILYQIIPAIDETHIDGLIIYKKNNKYHLFAAYFDKKNLWFISLNASIDEQTFNFYIKNINNKRPFHFELNYWHIEDFLTRQIGYRELREQGLIINLKTYGTDILVHQCLHNDISRIEMRLPKTDFFNFLKTK